MVRAQEGGSPPPTQQQQDDDEARIAALEAAARARKGFKAEQAEAYRGSRSTQVCASGMGVVALCVCGKLQSRLDHRPCLPTGHHVEARGLSKCCHAGFVFWQRRHG